jgi:hypothetical protein
VTIFGVPWGDLELDHVRHFLADAPSEPLLWEAKGVKAHPDEIRKQVCGFANSHEGGYLIIGAEQGSDGSWSLSGVTFRDEAPLWISNVVGDRERGVRPYPEGLDTRALPTADGRQVAIVRIPPIATPPCITRGTVYERVSGRTITATEPLRLAELFARGDQARRGAELKANHAAVDMLRRGLSHPHHADTHIQFGLGLSAAGCAPDISSRLFSHHFELCVVSSIQTVLSQDGLAQPGGPTILPDMSQEARMFEIRSADARLGNNWIVRITWNGAIGIYWVQGVWQTRVESVVSGPLREAWTAADEMLDLLTPHGGRHLTIVVAGAMFPPNPAELPHWDQPPSGLPVVARGPLSRGVSDIVLASIERELRRATGEVVYEPPS